MRTLIVGSLFLLGGAAAAHAQASAAAIDTEVAPTALEEVQSVPPRAESDSVEPRRGAEFLLPLGSLMLPGLGQYVQRAPARGAAFTSTTIAGIALARTGDVSGRTWEGEFPRRGRDQIAEQAAMTAVTAASLSAWDAFHGSVPALQRQGKYEFLKRRETVSELLSAPFDYRFLRRWTTWVDLTQTALFTALVLSDRNAGAQYVPFRGGDALYSSGVSFNAAVAEEALFRGWLLPVFHQHTGQRFWLANGMQATLFGAAHLPNGAWEGAAFIGAWALWEGWITRRNDWSVRESIFHHFWFNTALISATLLTEKRETTQLRINFPAITF